ncbi:MAG TPA: hypothetical protein PKI55_04175 [Chitinophagaceae bacterium]|nr:hypothetical protein [Chitinophagaceae bacterium]
MSNGYVIHVGHHSPSKAIVATPDARTGQPIGDIFEVTKQLGAFQIINRATVWARRVMQNGKLPDDGKGNEVPLEATDQRYKGDLEFLKWNDNKTGAQAIQIRYLRQSRSLDYEYQTVIQKITTRVEDGTDFIILPPGENQFDPNKDALLIKFLEVHPQNRDSESKNPDPMIKGYTYFEKTEKDADAKFIKHKENAIDAGLLLKQLSIDPAKLKNLFEIFVQSNVDFGSVSILSPNGDIYATLLKYSETDPEDMMKRIDRYKTELIKRFEYAKSFNALDLTKDGVIGLTVENKPNIIYDKVEGKGNKMIDYVVDNFVDPVIYEKTKHFTSLLEKVK